MTRKYKGPYFTEKEKQIMIKYYKKEGYLIEKRLPKRSRESIRLAAISLGLYSPNEYENAPWSSEEITLLKKIKHLPLLEIQRQLPWRSLSSISHKLEREGLLKKSRWSKEEIDILKKYNGCPPIGLLNRSECAIQHKVSKLGLQMEKRWTDEEIEILKKYGNDVPPGLLDRSKIAIRGKLQKLKEQGCTDGTKRV